MPQKTILARYPDAIRAKIKPYDETALHVAASAGNLKVVEELVKLMSVKELEIQDDFGNTALSNAATVGNTKMAECLVSTNQNLLTFENKEKMTPLAVACLCNNKDMTLYLYSVTPFEFLCQDNGIHGSYFLQCAIRAQMLDIAFDFLHRFPRMTTIMHDVTEQNALMILSKMPEIFPSGNRLALWQQWIYSCIPIESIATAGDNFCICMPDQNLSGSKNITLQVMSKLRGIAINLLTLLGIKQIYDLKKIHIYSDEILRSKLSPPSQLARISGAALQMQRELQWYKEVESFMNPTYKDTINESQQTARELFTHDHKDLLVKGEEWMKGSATSCTVVGALIITIMFTAVFTVPGGNVQETGYPIFRDKKSFTVFIVADAISFFSSSTSVLMFLGILTSRYADEDFLKSLPKKLIFGLSTLFLSIAAMMVTFCAALIIMLNGRLEVVIPVVLLASIPVTFFMLLQFPLLVEIFVSTYGPGIFNKKMKRCELHEVNSRNRAKACHYVMITVDGKSRNLFESSIASRQEKVFSLFDGAWSKQSRICYLLAATTPYSNMTTNNRQQQQRFPGHEERFVEAESSQGSGAVSDEMNGPLLTLYKYAHNGDWDAIKNYLSRYPNAKKARIKPYGGTVLHVAAFSGNLKVVEELVKLMSVEELEMQDNQGNTGLSSAAFVGIRKMAECFVSKNRNLVTFVNAQKRIPLVQACISNCKDMALYLYSVTPFEFLCQDNGHHGSYFLQCAIGAQMLDIVFDFLHRFPCMATKTDDVLKSNALIRLSTSPQIFPSASRLAFWEQFFCSCICSQPIVATNDTVRIYVPAQSLRESKNIVLHGIKQIYDLKKIHIYSDKILRCMCEYISTLDYEEQLKASVHAAFHSAVKNGTVEFIMEMIKACPHVIICTDENSRTLFMSSIANRQEKVVSLIYGLEASRSGFVSLIDSSGNTMLHLAAKLSPPSQLSRISGAALQMQRELQWYKEVESIINPRLKDHCNEDKQTTTELFTNEHKDLLEKGEQWMKRVATSCTVVGALIITIMFTVAFTVPGGNVQETGYPVFKNERSFTVFIVADAISLFSASTSVLMFLGILTSRYSENDFLKSLPTKLILGLSTLFLSIASMMVTFCAALIIMLNGRLEIVISVVLLASIPVTFFMLLQFPLLVEIFKSTYGPGIFNKKMKHWY
ncbi:hypothetical protein OIU76_012977 [Salix suchowensis]|nr:hypothetical protein OIU76_012977 [Salix suchowensis]